MIMKTFDSFFIGFIIGYISMLMIAIIIATPNQQWQPKVIERNAAHWTSNGTFEWNTITTTNR